MANDGQRLFRLRHRIRVIMLPPGTITVGRRSTCDVILQDGQISREHARVIVTSSSAAIEDLHSSNGVLVNGKPIRGLHRLNPGDRIRIGDETIDVIGFSEASERPSETTYIGRASAPRDWDADPERPTSVTERLTPLKKPPGTK